MRKEDVKKGSIYELDGVVPLKEALPLGIQHVLAMFLGNISPLLIIAGMLGLSPDLKSALIQNAMFIAGAVTLVQLYPVWKIGAKLPIVMGTSSGFIGTAKAMGALYGYGALMGIDVDKTISFTFLLGSALAGVAGVLVGIYYNSINPLMGMTPGLKAFIAAVFGGIGSIPGAMIGGLFIGIAETMVTAYGSSLYKDAIVYIILILILILKPAGLLGKNVREKV